MEIIKNIGVGLTGAFIILFMIGASRAVTSNMSKPAVDRDSATQIVENYSKQDYLDQVKANGGESIELCAYDYLLDKYGVREVMKMDMKAMADEDDIDPRLFRAVEECL